MTRRPTPLVTAVSLLFLLVLVASTASVPYVTISPGNAYNTLGTVDGTELITIAGTTTYPTSGALDMLTVTESGGAYGRLTLGDAVLAWRDPDSTVVPREWLFPDTVDPDEARQEMVADFDQSQSDAIAASMKHLGKPVTTTVIAASVSAQGPSNGLIAPGDALLAVDGTPVSTSAAIGQRVRSRPIGSTIELSVRTGTKAPTTVRVVSAPRPDDPAVPYIGILTGERYSAPFPVTFGLTGVVGPSAGLMLSMGIVDKLTPGELTGGRTVAGTGTIDSDGAVGAIGGITQKLVAAHDAGAELFLAPRENCADIGDRVPEGLTVVPVTTLDSAIEATGTWLSGGRLPSCGA